MKLEIRKYYTHIILIVLGVILYSMANFQRIAIPGAIFDTLQSDLHLTSPSVTALGAVFMYSYAVTLLICGIMVDKFGGIKVIIAGAILFSLGALIFPNTDNLCLLYISRFVMGVGAATFYISLIPELKKCFPDKYFGLAISLTLLSGHIGGICANAPFVMLESSFGWHVILNILAMITLIVTVSFITFRLFLHHVPHNDSVKFSIEPFKDVLLKRCNRNLFLFIGINYGVYYVIQTTIGSKFLRDFLNLSANQSSMILSVMIIIAASSGVVLATISKIFDNKRVIFLKGISITSAIIFFVISICLVFNFKTILIPVLLVILPVCGGTSPLAIPILHATNKYEERGTALSILNCCSFLSVGFLASSVGYLLDVFPPVSSVHLIYSNKSYLLIFAVLFVLSLVGMNFVLKLKDV